MWLTLGSHHTQLLLKIKDYFYMPIRRKLVKDQDVSNVDDNEFLDILQRFNEMQDLDKYHCMICRGVAVQSPVRHWWVECGV